MRDWELVDSDRFSFEDSDRFEEDSLCSWASEPESVCNNWRGWKRANAYTVSGSGNPNAPLAILPSSNGNGASKGEGGGASGGGHPNLVELAAKCVASHIPFEMVERFYPPVPEQLQLRIAFWSFPEHEEDIRLYSCLANGSAEEFNKGERLFKNDSVSDILQIGFHLSATVRPRELREGQHKVAVTFDRRRITTCTCSCNSATNWCGHVVAVCLHRIFQTKDVTLRAPVSESLSRLHRDQLQKFAQYLISELPQQILPTAQRLLDELLSSQRSAINTLRGAPDPTAGASANEQTAWFLDEKTLHGNIHKILVKFCVPAPIVFSDVNYLSSAAPPASAEWSSLLRPLRGREPEGMWNLLSIVREMFRREDRNAIPLLEVITEECLNCDQILVWWFNTKVALHNGNSGHGGKHHSVNSNAHACQHAGSSLCDEIVILWRLAALNPGISPDERSILLGQFKEWHLKVIEKVSKSRNASVGSKHANSFKNDVEVFPGFRPAVEASYLTWESYPIPGITYSESSKAYHCPFMCFRHLDGHSRSGETGLIHSSHAILNNPVGEHHLLHSSATISSVPGLTSKRPRSVECAQERNDAPSTSDPVAGPSRAVVTFEPTPGPSGSGSSKPSGGKSGKGRKSKANSTISASGLKIKEDGFDSFSSSFDGDASGPVSVAVEKVSGISEAAGHHLADLAVSGSPAATAAAVIVPRLPSPPIAVNNNGGGNGNDNRSSVSSEGFCDNENEIPDPDPEIVENENDEGVEDILLEGEANLEKVNDGLSQSLNTTTSEENDDVDSDSSIFTRSGAGEAEVPSIAGPEGPPEANGKKSDSCDSQQSGDEYQLYYYDTKTSSSGPSKSSSSAEESGKEKGKDGSANVFGNIKRMEDPWDVLFARAEGLHAHGHSKEACTLGVKLATDLLANPPNLTTELPAAPVGKGKRKKTNPHCHQISCLASTTLAKCGFLCTVLAENSQHYFLAFQVGMFGLELMRPPASTKPLEVKLANQEAELAQLLKRIPVGQQELEMVREKAERLKIGTFKSRGEALLPLVLANFIFDVLVMPSNREGRCSLQQGVFHNQSDESLGFEAAVAALGLKANVSEADHPLLCEGTRRQRGDLALAMLLHYKDEPEKLAKIMDKLLDRDIHQLYKASLPPAYYSNNPPTAPLLAGSLTCKSGDETAAHAQARTLSPAPADAASSTVVGSPQHGPTTNGNNNESTVPNANSGNGTTPGTELNGEANGEGTTANAGTVPASTNAPVGNGNCSNSNNGTSFGSSSSSSPVVVSNGGQGQNSMQQPSLSKLGRFKGKRPYPVLPNQPSEASAHFMFELAKVVLGKAGGSSNQSLFTQSNGQNPRGPHRALHMCAFHMGLYALGLHNAVSPNWLSRTYSSHVSWITGQAMEIGAPAIAFLIDTWDSHLTPPEAVTIADRASRGDANMVRAAAELALSCLPFAHALNPSEIHRAILQCKEQSDGMLEKACLTVEAAAKGGGVYPEVLFDVARQWFTLYQKHVPSDIDVFNDVCNHHDSLISLDGSPLDPLNTNGHGQLVSPQTGLPPLNPNNPPQPPPSVSSSGQSAGPDMMQMPPPSSHHNPSVYPMAAQQVPGPYGQVPYLPTNFNAVPGNFVYSQAFIYPTNGPSGPSTSSSSYYNSGQQHNAPQQPQQGGSYMPPNIQYPHPPSLPHSHAIVSAGPPLPFYPAPMPSVAGLRPGPVPSGAQFFPIPNSHPHQQMAGGNGLVVTSGHPMNVAASMGMNGMMPQSMSHPGHPGHLVPVQGSGNMHQHQHGPPPPGPPGGQGPPIMGNVPMMQGRGPNQSQMGNCGGPVSMYLQGNNIMPPQMHPGQMQMGMGEMPPTSSASQLQHFMVPTSRESVSVGQHQNGQSAVKIKYLLAAYRVGMLALEALARRVHDDRPQAKFARNPPYGEDVKWLLSISRKLGAQYLQQFCMCAVSSISNPFVLHEIILDASMIPTRNNHLTWVYQNPRSPLAPLVQKCQQMYFQCLHQKLYHMTPTPPSDYEDFVSIVCNAKQACHLTQDGISQFKEWLANLRRSKACKKELWGQITAALQSTK